MRKGEITAEIIEYARQIGIDVENEHHLMWIAHEGIQALVPHPWFPVEDEKGNIYYFNQRTGESMWDHPCDAYYCTLVIEERDFHLRNKSLNTTCSDPGFESKMPLETIYDVKDAPRFTKNPLPMLSSLADAPPLSSGGNKTLATLSKDSTKTLFSGKSAIGKLDHGLDSNKLAPMKLDSLNKSQSSALDHLTSKSSVFPKGSMVKNVKKGKSENSSKAKKKEPEFASVSQRIVKFDLDDNSEEGSHYSYEETDYEGDDFPDVDDMILDRFGILDASQLSPAHSAEGSPEPLDVNSLVKMKLSDNSLHVPHPYLKAKGKTNLNDDEISTSSNSRKMEKKQEQKPLKPLETKSFSLGENLRFEIEPPESPKSDKPLDVNHAKQLKSNLPKGISEKTRREVVEEQNAILENLLQEWKIKQEELDKEEKAKFDKMKVEWELKLKEEQDKLREEHANQIQQLQEEMSAKMEREETTLKLSLDNMKSSNADKLLEGQKKYEAELNESLEALKKETDKKKEKIQQELNEQIKALEAEHQKNIEKIKEEHSAELKKIESELQTEDGEAKASEENGNAESELKEIKELVEKEQQKLLDLQKEISIFEDQKKNFESEHTQLKETLKEDGQTLKELQEEKLLIQRDVEELQEEVEKIENDLDMLRGEKTAMFNELTRLKDEVSKEKILIVDLRKEKEELENKRCEMSDNSVQVKPVFESKQVSAEIPIDDKSCQVELLQDVPKSHVAEDYSHESKEFASLDVSGKTNMEETVDTENVSKSHGQGKWIGGNSYPQADTAKATEEVASSQQIIQNKGIPVSSSIGLSEEKTAKEEVDFQHVKQVENLPEQSLPSEEKLTRHYKDMQEFYTKVMSEIDNRMKFMAQHVKSLEDRVNFSSVPDTSNKKETLTPVTQNNQNFTTNYSLPNSHHPFVHKSEHDDSAKQPTSTNVPQVTYSSHPAAGSLNFSVPVPAASSKSCYCELGDSCEILLGLKHSLHHLQQQVHQQFVPPWTNLPQKRFHPSTSQDSSLEDFRSGLKQLRDRHNSTLLRFQLEQSVHEQSSAVLNQIPGTSRDMPELRSNNQPDLREFPVYYKGWMSSSPPGSSNEAITRARDIVRREQERSRIQSLYFTRQSPPLFESYSFQASHSGLQVPNSSNNHPFGVPAQISPLESPISPGYGIHFRQMRPEIVTEHEIKADLEAWLAKIQGMHQRIRRHDRL